jgi:hypothetical protein
MPARRANLLSPGLAQEGLGGKPHTVELVCGFEENTSSGAFTLTINR